MGRHSEERIDYALRLHEMGLSVEAICHKLRIDRRTFYCWRGKREAPVMSRLKVTEQGKILPENARESDL